MLFKLEYIKYRFVLLNFISYDKNKNVNVKKVYMMFIMVLRGLKWCRS